MTLKIIQFNPTLQLAAAPANSYFRMRHYGLPAGAINSAYRSFASQDLIFRSRYRQVSYWTPIRYDGDYWIHVSGLPVAVPGTSKHNQGLALDIAPGSYQESWLLAHGSKHGWHRPLPQQDRVHWEYVVTNDEVLRKLKNAQSALRVGQTGLVDAATQKAAVAVRAANQSPPKFPHGIRYAQSHSGTNPDGDWGAKSKAANIATVKKFQTAIGVRATGYWTLATDVAWKNLGK